MRTVKKALLSAVLVSLSMVSAYAGTQGHYYPGVMGVRDAVLPPKGFYTIVYAPYYFSNDYQNANGNSFSTFSDTRSRTEHIDIRGHQIPITITGNINADLDISSNFAIQQVMLLWSSGWQVLGADFGMMIAPSEGYVDIDVRAKANGTGTLSIGDYSRSITREENLKLRSQSYGFGDLLVSPLMLDWRTASSDLGFYYSFVAPTGAYAEDRLANVGMGFWTHQFQGAFAYYFNKNRSTAATITATYDLNSSIYDKDLTPGQSITIEYGLDQYFTERASLGVTAYDQWQISADSGSAAKNKDVFYQIHGVGAQACAWIIAKRLCFTGKFICEYYGVDRFRGYLATGNLTMVF